MNKKTLITVLISIIILGGLVFWALKSEESLDRKGLNGSQSATNSQMIFFYGTGCPHCANVEKFLEENKGVEEKLKFEKLDVWSNKEYAELMAEKAKNCGISTENLGVPFFWDGSKCITGDADIINYFKQQINQ